MKIFDNIIKDFADYDEIERLIDKQSSLVISGCIDATKEHILTSLIKNHRMLLVTYDEIRARRICDELKAYGRDTYYYPAKDVIFYNADIHGGEIATERIKAISALIEESDCIIVASVNALMDNILPMKKIEDAIEYISMDSTIDIKALSEKLVYLGYERVPQVELSGEFAVRGGIIDIFPVTLENPVRIDLWGDDIDSIKTFDVSSQRSIENIDSFSIYPAKEYIFDGISDGISAIEKEFKSQYKTLMDLGQIEAALRLKKNVDELIDKIKYFKNIVTFENLIGYFTKETVSFLSYFKASDYVVVDEPQRVYA